MNLYQDWIKAKAMEKAATEKRRGIEDKLVEQLAIPENFEGSKTIKTDYVVKITGRMNRKVDVDKLQDIAIEQGTSDMLGKLFRWKADINTAIWRSTDKEITDPLLGAITTKPGQISFTITENEEN